ncbi:DUF192 domain-containing protein [Ostreiculturibacter nitratireducens]|uniref:DUF192 domain-containing protein n=1 Tax=Ostreiculturibacter nitratireducens TaxID=3075226 RepID=UPI0031B6224D
MIRAAVLWLAMAGAAASADCRDDLVEFRWDGGQARFTVEVADDEGERAQGLMHREALAASAGMLFVYERTQEAAFWMENTLIPLDMIFIDETGRVTRVHENARPLDRTPIPSGGPIRYVLEINGGLAARIGIAPGAVMRHPAVDQALSAWPCG